MKLIQALVRPGKLDALKGALEDACVRSIAIMSVRYRGPEKRPVTAFRGFLISEDYVDQLGIEMVVQDDDVDRIVGVILRTARTGAPGDGHVSISPIDHRYDIHSGYRETC
jgi:nitrogen regulatory protein P-II 1